MGGQFFSTMKESLCCIGRGSVQTFWTRREGCCGDTRFLSLEGTCRSSWQRSQPTVGVSGLILWGNRTFSSPADGFFIYGMWLILSPSALLVSNGPRCKIRSSRLAVAVPRLPPWTMENCIYSTCRLQSPVQPVVPLDRPPPLVPSHPLGPLLQSESATERRRARQPKQKNGEAALVEPTPLPGVCPRSV